MRRLSTCTVCLAGLLAAIPVLKARGADKPTPKGAESGISTDASPPSVDSMLSKAKLLYDMGDKESLSLAHTRIGWVLRQNPESRAAYLLGSKVSFKGQEWDKLLEYSRRWANACPEDALAFLYRGIANDKKLDTDAALRDYDKAVSLNENLGSAFLWRGHLKSRRENYQGAADDFGRAAQVAPDSKEAKVLLEGARKKLSSTGGERRIGSVNENGSSYKYYPEKRDTAKDNYSTAIAGLTSEERKVTAQMSQQGQAIGAATRRVSVLESKLRRLKSQYRGVRNTGDDLENEDQERLKYEIDSLERDIQSKKSRIQSDSTSWNNLKQRKTQLEGQIKSKQAEQKLADQIRKKAESQGQADHHHSKP